MEAVGGCERYLRHTTLYGMRQLPARGTQRVAGVILDFLSTAGIIYTAATTIIMTGAMEMFTTTMGTSTTTIDTANTTCMPIMRVARILLATRTASTATSLLKRS